MMTSTNNNVYNMDHQAIRSMDPYQDRCLPIDHHHLKQQQQQQQQLLRQLQLQSKSQQLQLQPKSQHQVSYNPISISSSRIISNSKNCNNNNDKNDSAADDDENEKYLTAVKSLGPYEVICGRGSVAFNNIGNRRFRILIGLNVEKYAAAEGRHKKGCFIGALVNELVREIGARFYKFKNGKLTELAQSQIRQKVGHALRDTLAFQESQQQQQDQKQKEKTPRPAAAPPSLSSEASLSSMRSRVTIKTSNKTSSSHNSYSCGFPNQTQTLSLPPMPPPPTPFAFQESLKSFDFPKNNIDGDDRRASTPEARDFSSNIEGPSFFPVSARDKRQRKQQHKQQREKQQEQRPVRSSFEELEGWRWDSTDTRRSDNINTEDNSNNNNNKTQKNTKDNDGIDINDPFKNADLQPISIYNLIPEQHNNINVHEV